jgi:putative Mg2+ transporter-C (MgtC) family protein
MEFSSSTYLTELVLAGAAFVLSAAIGVERQLRQKSAGLRTHTLVGTGSAVFTLVSAYGFSSVTGPESVLDPARIAAQIVSGIGFLGAGVIFVNRDVVRGLTTAATIWMTAAIGMACGAGMIPLAAAATGFHFLAVGVLAPLARLLPSADGKRTIDIRYLDGQGILRDILTAAGDMGFDSSVLSTRRLAAAVGEESPHVSVRMRFRGKPPLRDLIAQLDDIHGVKKVSVASDSGDQDDSR